MTSISREFCLLGGAVAICLVCTESADANTSYNVVPVITATSNSIVGGTIVTDGTLGTLTPANIISSSIIVTRDDVPTNFTTFNILGSIQASSTALYIPHSFENEFNRYFTSQTGPLVNYSGSRTVFGSSVIPDGTIQHATINIAPPGGSGTVVQMLSPIDLVIAVREIPEPHAISLLGIGIGYMLIARAKRAPEEKSGRSTFFP